MLGQEEFKEKAGLVFDTDSSEMEQESNKLWW